MCRLKNAKSRLILAYIVHRNINRKRQSIFQVENFKTFGFASCLVCTLIAAEFQFHILNERVLRTFACFQKIQATHEPKPLFHV